MGTVVMLVLGMLALAARPEDAMKVWAQEQAHPDPHPIMSQGYRFTGPAMLHAMQRAEERPGVVDIEVFGHSVSGAPLVALHITEPGAPVTDEVLVFAGIHALEWIGTESAWQWADALIDRPVPGTRVTIIPLMNPDGRARVESDLVDGRDDVYRRGNKQLVDLNRDFAVGREPRAIWRRIIPNRYSSSPSALSQPETQALDDLLSRHQYRVGVSLHAFGGYLYHPWSSSWERPANWREYVETGRRMEAAQGAHAYRTRQLSRWGFFFRAHGTELDHLHQAHQMQSWLFEITRSGFRRPSDRRTPFRWYNPRRPAPHVSRVIAALEVLLQRPDVIHTPVRPQRTDGR